MILANRKKKMPVKYKVLILSVTTVIVIFVLLKFIAHSTLSISQQKGNKKLLADAKLCISQTKLIEGPTVVPYFIDSSKRSVKSSKNDFPLTDKNFKQLAKIAPQENVYRLRGFYGDFKYVSNTDDGTVVAVLHSKFDCEVAHDTVTVLYGDKSCQFKIKSAYCGQSLEGNTLFVMTSTSLFSVDLNTMQVSEVAVPSQDFSNKRIVSFAALNETSALTARNFNNNSIISAIDIKTSNSYSSEIQGHAVAFMPVSDNSFYVLSCEHKGDNKIDTLNAYLINIKDDALVLEKSSEIPLLEGQYLIYDGYGMPNITDENGVTIFSQSKSDEAIMIHVNKETLEIDASQTFAFKEFSLKDVALIKP